MSFLPGEKDSLSGINFQGSTLLNVSNLVLKHVSLLLLADLADGTIVYFNTSAFLPSILLASRRVSCESLFHLLALCIFQKLLWNSVLNCFMVFICLWGFPCPSGGHSFTVGVHKYTAWPGMIFYFMLLICIVFFFFLLRYHLFLFVCLFVFFSFFLPPPILGIRSLAGGHREYGRSGREQLF